MTTIGDVHVGDIGTLYRGEIQDAGEAFNPSDATTKVLKFKKPDGTVLERTASVATAGVGPAQVWYLQYQLTETYDLNFHNIQGKYQWQGFIEFANGDRYHTNVETHTVKPNLN